MNPMAQMNEAENVMDPPHIVPIQLKNFTPVGIAINIDMIAKNGSST